MSDAWHPRPTNTGHPAVSAEGGPHRPAQVSRLQGPNAFTAVHTQGPHTSCGASVRSRDLADPERSLPEFRVNVMNRAWLRRILDPPRHLLSEIPLVMV